MKILRLFLSLALILSIAEVAQVSSLVAKEYKKSDLGRVKNKAKLSKMNKRWGRKPSENPVLSMPSTRGQFGTSGQFGAPKTAPGRSSNNPFLSMPSTRGQYTRDQFGATANATSRSSTASSVGAVLGSSLDVEANEYLDSSFYPEDNNRRLGDFLEVNDDWSVDSPTWKAQRKPSTLQPSKPRTNPSFKRGTMALPLRSHQLNTADDLSLAQELQLNIETNLDVMSYDDNDDSVELNDYLVVGKSLDTDSEYIESGDDNYDSNWKLESKKSTKKKKSNKFKKRGASGQEIDGMDWFDYSEDVSTYVDTDSADVDESSENVGSWNEYLSVGSNVNYQANLDTDDDGADESGNLYLKSTKKNKKNQKTKKFKKRGAAGQEIEEAEWNEYLSAEPLIGESVDYDSAVAPRGGHNHKKIEGKFAYCASCGLGAVAELCPTCGKFIAGEAQDNYFGDSFSENDQADLGIQMDANGSTVIDSGLVVDNTAGTPAPDTTDVYGEGRYDNVSPELDSLLVEDEGLSTDMDLAGGQLVFDENEVIGDSGDVDGLGLVLNNDGTWEAVFPDGEDDEDDEDMD